MVLLSHLWALWEQLLSAVVLSGGRKLCEWPGAEAGCSCLSQSAVQRRIEFAGVLGVSKHWVDCSRSLACAAGVTADEWASEQPPAGFGGGVDPAIGAGGPVGAVSGAADWDAAPAPAGAGGSRLWPVCW